MSLYFFNKPIESRGKLARLLNAMIKQKHPVRYFISRLFVNYPTLFQKLYFRRNGYKLSMSSNSIAASFFVYGKDYLSYDEQVLTSLIAPKQFFVDVGANIGHLSLALARSSGLGLAIEANTKTFKVLEQNIEINQLSSRVICLNYAVGESDNIELKIQDSYADDCNSIVDSFELVNENNDLYTVAHSNFFTVEARTLDSLAKEHCLPDRIRLLKIDVEGYELFVLKGALTFLQSTEMIYFEYWDKLTRKYSYDKTALFTLLESLNFRLYYSPKVGLNGLERSEVLIPIGSTSTLKDLTNILGVNFNLLQHLRDTELTAGDLMPYADC